MLGHTVTLGLVAQGHIMAPGPQGYDGSSAQVIGVHSNNHMVLGEHCGSIALWLQGPLDFSAACPGSMAREQDKEQWWPEMVGCMHSAAVASCRCLCSGRGQMQIHS